MMRLDSEMFTRIASAIYNPDEQASRSFLFSLAHEPWDALQFASSVDEGRVQIDVVAHNYATRSHRSPCIADLPSHIGVTVIGVVYKH